MEALADSVDAKPVRARAHSISAERRCSLSIGLQILGRKAVAWCRRPEGWPFVIDDVGEALVGVLRVCG
jgi:hypothetical protein